MFILSETSLEYKISKQFVLHNFCTRWEVSKKIKDRHLKYINTKKSSLTVPYLVFASVTTSLPLPCLACPAAWMADFDGAKYCATLP